MPLIPYDREQERQGSSTAKLQRLKQTVDEASASLDFSSKPAILLSFWAYEHLYNTTREWPTEERSDAALSLSSLRSKRRLDIDAAPSLRNLAKTRFIQRFDSLLLLSSRDRNGFDIRIVGVAVGDDQ